MVARLGPLGGSSSQLRLREVRTARNWGGNEIRTFEILPLPRRGFRGLNEGLEVNLGFGTSGYSVDV